MEKFPKIVTGTDVSRQVLADSPALMVVDFTFGRAGAEGKQHSHRHVQSTFVKSGRFEFVIDGVKTTVGPGDCFVVPSGAEHGCVCLEPGTLIDSFAPRRDDFL